MKTPEELNALKEEVEAVNEKLRELTEDELAQVSGGGAPVGLKSLSEMEDFGFISAE